METGVEPESLADEGLEATSWLRGFFKHSDAMPRPGQDDAREETAEARPYDQGVRHSG